MEKLARLKIVLGLNGGADYNFRQQWQYMGSLYYSQFDPSIRDFIISAINKTQLSKADWQIIESLTEKSLQLRKRSGPTPNLATDLLVSGALCERKNMPSEAYAFFFQAIKL